MTLAVIALTAVCGPIDNPWGNNAAEGGRSAPATDHGEAADQDLSECTQGS